MSGYNAVLARNTEDAPTGVGPYSQTVAFSHYNHFAAQLPIDPKTGDLVEGDAKTQAEQCFANLAAVVNSIDQTMDDLVRVTIFLTDMDDFDAVTDVYAQYFPDYRPTLTVVGVEALPLGASVQVEAVGSYGLGTIPDAPQAGDLVKVANNTDKAPESALSTQTVAFSHYNNLSAQLPIDPATGELVDGDVAVQAAQAFNNVKAILESIDVPFDDIVKVNLYLEDLDDLDAVDEVYTTFFPDSAIARTVAYYPARTVVAASALPLGAAVQVETVVSHGDGTPPQAVEDRHGLIVEPNDTDAAPLNPLSTQTVAFSHYNNISGQLPVDPATGELVDGDVKAQADQCLANLKEIVESIDHSLEDVVKVNLFLTDIDDAAAVDEVYSEYFPGGVPARRTVQVAALPDGALIEIDAVVSNAEGTPPLV